MLRVSCAAALLLAASPLVVSCGGGGGSGNAANGSFSLDTSQVTFSAAAPPATLVTPGHATLKATVNGTLSGTLYIRVDVGNPALVSVTNIRLTSDTTGEADVIPAPPDTLAAGTHATTLTVRACVNSPNCSSGQLAGSPRTVTVNYVVAPPVAGNVVAPGTVAAGTAGRVILRGAGLAGASSVAFGGNNATAVTQISDTEIHAGVPAMPAGTYAITVNGGSIPFAADLRVADNISYAPALLPYPASPLDVRALIYDPVHQALIVALLVPPTSTASLVARYQYAAGSWDAPLSVTVPEVRDAALAFDSDALYVVALDSLRELDPVTLATRVTVPPPAEGGGSTDPVELTSVALLNSGSAVLTSASSRSFVYSTQTSTFGGIQYEFAPACCGRLYSATTEGSPDGSRVVLIQGSLSPPQPSYEILASDGSIAPTGLVGGFKGFPHKPAEASLNGQGLPRAALLLSGAGVWPASVYDAGYQLIGTLPFDTRAVVLSPDGTRAYVLDEAGDVHAFDSSGGPSNDPLPAVGGVIATDVGVGAIGDNRLAITPDGNTLFISTPEGIVVRPVF